MKCEIIRDLMPSYIDGLTSEESNREVEEHLDGCRDCREYYLEMKAELSGEELTKETREKQKKEIQPFYKMKKAAVRRVVSAVIATAAVCLVLFGAYMMYYEKGTTAESDAVKITYEKVNGVVTIGFLPKDEKTYLDVFVGHDEGEETGIEIVKYHVSPFRKPIRRGGYYGITFIDEDTILDSGSGKKIDLTGEEEIEIKFADGTKTVNIANLYTEEGIESLR